MSIRRAGRVMTGRVHHGRVEVVVGERADGSRGVSVKTWSGARDVNIGFTDSSEVKRLADELQAAADYLDANKELYDFPE